MNARRFLVPETVQSSGMDCGPAALHSLLAGHRIPVDYQRLRDTCRTDIDGTSISVLAEVARDLGLDAEEVLVPKDHFGLGNRELPALVVTRLPDGNTHFVVAWRSVFGRLQLMDPATGRRWPKPGRFLGSLYEHTMCVPAADWREWAGGDDFQLALAERLRRVGVARSTARPLRATALEDSGWVSVGALDAATRCVSALVEAGAVRRGRDAARAVTRLFDSSCARETRYAHVPRSFWSVVPTSDEDESGELAVRGALLVRVRGVRAEGRETEPGAGSTPAPGLSRSRPWARLLRMGFTEVSRFRAVGLGLALALASAGVVLEGLLFRGVLEISSLLGPADQRLMALAALLSFLALMFVIELPIANGVLRAGRRLDARFRLSLLRKLPVLKDEYFRTRQVSDIAHRGHVLHALRSYPLVATELARTVFSIVVTAAAIAWWAPTAAWLAALSAVLTLVVPFASQHVLAERDLRIRTQEGSLARFYLDALVGSVPLRTHGAKGALEVQHERLMGDWARSRFALQRGVLGMEALQQVSGYGLAGWMMARTLSGPGGAGELLLLAYWALKLPALGSGLAELVAQYPMVRSTALRLLEPLEAPERGPADEEPDEPETEARSVSLHFDGVDVQVAGKTLLSGITVEIEAGAHVAVVGRSGSGKSTLLGTLLGWHAPASGRIVVDGRALSEASRSRLLRHTAWIDPAVQLWNRSLSTNLSYGCGDDAAASMSERSAMAELEGVIGRLGGGFRESLGESGCLLSGGEGQRVRLARALGREDVRLALLDEPFRGLSRDRRRRLLERTRARWRDQTVLCATHDVRDTLGFDQVIVLEGGRIVESGVPRELLRRTGSRYRELLDAERRCEGLFRASGWRTWSIAGDDRTASVPDEEVS